MSKFGFSISRTPRQGLTLIELIVVLVILIGLAGILIPMLPNMLGRTHNATVATNLSEINRSIQVFQGLNNAYPDQWDALTDGNNVISYMAGGEGAPAGGGTAATQVGGQISAEVLTDNEIKALNEVGITRVHLMAATLAEGRAITNWDPTFNPYQTSPSDGGVGITTGTKVAVINPSALASVLPGASLKGKYVLLGLGQRNRIIGRGMMEPPVVFGDNPNLSPTIAYTRFVCVFQVSDSALTTPMSKAVFLGALEPDDSGLHNVNDETKQWFNSQNNNK